ncbi:MAG: ROK family transcriptional regulator [Thermotogota bacterium]
MKINTINSEHMGYSNKLLILNLIRRNPGISRKELAKVTNLDKSTITKITNNLIDRNIVAEEGTKVRKTPGRKSIRLIPVKKSAEALVVKVGVEETHFGKGYLNNEYEVIEKFKTPKDFNSFIKLLVEKIKNIDYTNEKLVGISFSIPGMVDRDNRFIESAPHLNWTNVSLEEELKKEMKEWVKPVMVANEAKLSLLSEKYSNKNIKRIHNGVYIFISQGIGGAILLDGKIILGPSNTAGEFGHMSLEPDGEKCSCNNLGCWENYVSIDTTVNEFGDIKGENSEEKFIELLKLYNKDEKAKEVIDRQIYYIGFGVSNLVNILNPEFIILGGNGFHFSDEILDGIKKEIKNRSLSHASEKLNIVKPYHNIVEACMLGSNLMIMDEFSKLIIS